MVKGKKFESDFKSPWHRGKEKQQVELLLQFLESSKNYCVCVVDMVGSTSIAMGMSNEKIGMDDGAFLNMMAVVLKFWLSLRILVIVCSIIFRKQILIAMSLSRMFSNVVW